MNKLDKLQNKLDLKSKLKSVTSDVKGIRSNIQSKKVKQFKNISLVNITDRDSCNIGLVVQSKKCINKSSNDNIKLVKKKKRVMTEDKTQ